MLVESFNNAVYHYKKGNLNWPMIIYVTLVHTVAFLGLLRVHQCSPETLFWAFILWPIRYESELCWRQGW